MSGPEDLDDENPTRVGPAPSREGDDPFLEEQKRKALNKERGRKVVTVITLGALAVGAVIFVAVQVLAPSSPSGESTISQGSNVHEPQSAPLTPAEAERARRANDRERAEAQRNGQSYIQRQIAVSEEDPPPAPVPAPPPPPAPLLQTTTAASQAAIGPNDPRRQAMLAAMNLTIEKGGSDRGKLESLSDLPGGKSQSLGVAPLTTQPLAPTLQSTAKETEAPSGTPSSTGTLIASPHDAYAVLRIAADSDVPSEVRLEILSGPLVGGTVYGDPHVQNKAMGIPLTRLNFEGHDYAITAVVLDPKTRSAKLDADVNNHYFDRVALPALAGAFSLAGTRGSNPTSSITTTAGGVAATSSSALTPTQLGLAAAGGAGTAAGTVLSADAAEIKATVSLDADKPQIVTFLKGVYSGDRK